MKEDITVLYVDDEPINVMLFEVNFRKYYKVKTGVSGSDGISKLRSDPEISPVFLVGTPKSTSTWRECHRWNHNLIDFSFMQFSEG